MSTTGLTEQTRKALKTTVDAIRAQLISELYAATDQRFSFAAKNRDKLPLSPQDQYDWQLLQNWCQDPMRAQRDFTGNVTALIKEVAYTLTNRLFILRQLEARQIHSLPVLTGGKESVGYREFREFCPELCRGEDEGYGFLLQQVFDKIALDLPVFFGRQPLHGIVPLPGPTLFWLVEQLNQPKLDGAWTDDTTLGWLYQYWNDPDRTAVNDKIGGKGVDKGKVEAHEIAAATQLFTERYMVEWLLQNSLGVQWLAICEKQGWKPEAIGVIETLEVRRGQWREKLASKAVAEDMAMPIESVAEERWKFYVDQDISAEVVKAAPDSLKGVKILDPACGSGHFLVYAFDLLYAFYQEEARFTGEALSAVEIVNRILVHNLHGIDIDPRAVQLAASALFLKAQECAPGVQLGKINLVASDLGLANLATNDPSIKRFKEALIGEGLDPEPVEQLIESLKGANYLGSLLQIDKTQFQKSTLPLWQQHEEQNFAEALQTFMLTHDRGEDLGVRTRAEQLAKGLRLVELLGQKYQVVCANPPYLGGGKLDKDVSDRIAAGHSDAKYDLFAIFLSRIPELLTPEGFGSMITMHSWMFLSNYQDFRTRLLEDFSFTTVAHMGRGGGFLEWADFDKVMQTTMFVFRNHKPDVATQSEYFRLNRFRNIVKSYILVSQNNRFTFYQCKFKDIEGAPMIYWWPEEFRKVYLESSKVGKVGEVRQGMATSNNSRFLRNFWEANFNSTHFVKSDKNKPGLAYNKIWHPYLKGAKGKRWFEPLSILINYKNDGFEVKKFADVVFTSWTGRIINRHLYFKQGMAFSYIGTEGFQCRLRKYKSIFDVSGSSIFVPEPEKAQVLLSSEISGYVSQAINPTINNQVGDIDYLPIFDVIPNWHKYYEQAEMLYDQNFASKETCVEYTYQHIDPEYFEASEIGIRSAIDKEIYSQFSPSTISAIKEEVGESPGHYSELVQVELEQASELFPTFADTYLNGPTKTEYGKIVTKADGTPERGRLQSLEELCHEFQLHPESIIALRKHLGLRRKSDRQQEAYRHLAWTMGVALGRFDAQTGGLVDLAAERRGDTPQDPLAPQALPHKMFMLSERAEMESATADDSHCNQGLEAYFKQILSYKHGEDIEVIWDEIQAALVYDCKESLSNKDRSKFSFNQFMRDGAFAFHKDVYENRPIYFPLCSPKRAYVVWCNIHTWHDSTLKDVHAIFLKPEREELKLHLEEALKAKVSASDNTLRQKIDKSIDHLRKWIEELDEMIGWVQQIADRGVAPDKQEREMPFVMDLDDGVMINSAALWPLLQPLWKDPKKWWEHLEKPVGKNDYDWSHLAMRYWPKRVWKKLEKDPSLAVAHSDYGEYKGKDLFKELHPAMAVKWEAEQAKRV